MTLCTSLSVGLLVFICLSSLSAGLPLTSTDNKAKRSSEVIFYENEQKSANMNKRSESWPIIPSNNDKQHLELQNAVDVETPAETEEDQAAALLTQEAEKAIKDKAFYEAVEFVMDELVGEALYDGYITEDVFKSEDPVDSGIPSQPADTKTDAEDQEAKQLASLLQQDEIAQSEKSDINLRADNSKQLELSESDQSDSGMSEMQEEEENPILESAAKAIPLDVEDYENYGLDDDYEYDFSNLLDYLDYLDMLKTVEGKLKTQLNQEKQNNQQEEQEKSVKSRKKRSLETSLQLTGKYGSHSDSSSASNRMELFGDGDEGLCFSAQEVAELKALLVQLAKEKIESEDLISYLLGTEGFDDLYDEGDDYDSRDKGDYYQEGKNSLYKLGGQMNRADKRMPLYAANQWPYNKK